MVALPESAHVCTGICTVRCALYLRVSSGKQEEGASLPTQEAQARAYARERGWCVTAVYTETHSGADLWERPVLTALRAQARRGELDVVLAHALDRLTRDQIHIAVLLDEFTRHNVTVAFTTEEFDSSPVGIAITNLRAFAAQVERQKLIERTRRGIAARAAAGKPLPASRPPYGYRWADQAKSRLEPDTNAPVVRRIFAALGSGGTLRGVAQALTRDGIPTPSGRSSTWNAASVRQIVRHPVYKGLMPVMRWETARVWENGQKVRKLREREAGHWQGLPHVAPALVDEATWNAVQERLQVNRQQAPRRLANPEAVLLYGHVRCGICNWAMASVCVRRDTYRYYFYRCRNEGHRFQVRASTVDADVWAQVVAALDDEGRIAAEVRRFQEAGEHETQQLAALERQVEECRKREQRLAASIAVLDDEDAVAVLRNQLTETARQKRGLVTEREVLTSRYALTAQAGDRVREFVSRVRLVLRGELTHADKRTALLMLGACVLLFPAGSAQPWRLEGSVPFCDENQKRYQSQNTVPSLRFSFTGHQPSRYVEQL